MTNARQVWCARHCDREEKSRKTLAVLKPHPGFLAPQTSLGMTTVTGICET